MKLVIVHNHFRPGGVRRVIELATPYLCQTLKPRIREIVLVGGEAPDEVWSTLLKERVAPAQVSWAIEPALGYFSEQRASPQALARRIRLYLEETLQRAGSNCWVWAHNQGLGRNLLLTQALNQVCADHSLPLLLHHHDWWFDNRWARWPEMRRAGYRSLASVARTLFPVQPKVRHAAINRADGEVLQRHLGATAAWLPNPAELPSRVNEPEIRKARQWLDRELGEPAPVWLVPCRLLRRKNLAEALLLTRWLRPESWLVTTGGVSSPAEQPYARKLESAAREHGWRLRLGVLRGNEFSMSVPELMAASEAVLLTSVQEGFGLPYVEAAAAARPLIARSLPNVSPDLEQFGFRFPQAYDELLIDSDLFDWSAEQTRQRNHFHHWRALLPSACRRKAIPPPLVSATRAPASTPFSRLTLTAQLEILRQPLEHSWARCVRVNPFLKVWRERAERGALRATPWPKQANQWLNGKAYARRWTDLVDSHAESYSRADSERCQGELMTTKLEQRFLYPLLWNTKT